MGESSSREDLRGESCAKDRRQYADHYVTTNLMSLSTYEDAVLELDTADFQRLEELGNRFSIRLRVERSSRRRVLCGGEEGDVRGRRVDDEVTSRHSERLVSLVRVRYLRFSPLYQLASRLDVVP